MTVAMQFAADEYGQDLVEYALLISIILVATLSILAGFTSSMAGVNQATNANLQLAADAIR